MSATPARHPPPSPYGRSSLGRLPVELIYETQLFALSEHFPYVCKYLCEVFKRSPPSFRAQYIFARVHRGVLVNANPGNVFTTAILYPICTQETVEALFRLPRFLAYGQPGAGDPSIQMPLPDLPKRLFRDLQPRVRRGIPVPWSDEDRPLPFLRYLFDLYNTRRMITGPPKFEARESYALTKAVAAGFVPLVKFLLGNGGDPRAGGAIAVMVAIQKRDLQMVKLLIEGDLDNPDGAKRRRVPDRVACTREMLQRAAKVDAQDIIQYLVAKGAADDIDMKTLRMFCVTVELHRPVS